MKVCYHDNSLTVRGTSVALWDYASWGEKLLGIEPVIMYNNTLDTNQGFVIDRFKSKFNVVSYSNINQIDDILKGEKCESFFMIKGGKKDGVISNVCENWINAISVCGIDDVHGQKYAMGSKWLSKITGNAIDYVSYMVDIPCINNNLRNELGIPDDAIVFGRNGGQDTFDILFVKQAVIKSLDLKNDIYFLFQGTDKFYDHPRIIYLPPSPDIIYKVKFINTCDVLLHARDIGESFGQVCAEFSMSNKPIITWYGSKERNHIEYLGNKGLYYNDYTEVLNLILSFTPAENIDWRCYSECLPEPTMLKFESFYMK